ncbi:fibulin-1-like isoform X3 [Lethenteron reissneri]|uniref:fibulin-1-like isoform X3 n=1 Tax=Lethenteron reissneri TaxID=7753 RepID=UPI002AB696A8|nr:fibulin-1-like isoform X3 [Lethenteron reissneri]
MGPRTAWMFVLYGSCSLLTFTAGQDLSSCCASGRMRAAGEGQCSQDARGTAGAEDNPCSVTTLLCCLASVRRAACELGMELATRGGETCNASEGCQSCCSCCRLGKQAQSLGLACAALPGLGSLCGQAFEACCRGGDRLPPVRFDEPTVEGGSRVAVPTRAPSPGLTALRTAAPLQENGRRVEQESRSGDVVRLPLDPCKGSARCDHKCEDVRGAAVCSCLPGFQLQADARACADVNECAAVPAPCPQDHRCVNTLGSFACQQDSATCGRGFRASPDGSQCLDVNECEGNPCSQECANVYGSYQCYCRRGFRPSESNPRACEDIDECTLFSGGNLCTHRCLNSIGSFQCTCPEPGYTVINGGRGCQDIDECATRRHDCSATETCFNVQGGFRCLSFRCPPNYRHMGERADPRKTESLRCLKLDCAVTDGACWTDPVSAISFTFISLPAYPDLQAPEGVIYLRVASPAIPTATGLDVSFRITEGNELGLFDVIKTEENGVSTGKVRLLRSVTGPVSTVLRLEMDYQRGRALSHRNVVYAHVYLSPYWF